MHDTATSSIDPSLFDTELLDPGMVEQMAAALMEGAQSGATLKELQGVSDDMLESVYAYAHRFYSNGRLDEAETFFRFLYMYDFHNGEYALGLAAVHQLKKEYAKAIDMYALAYALLKDDQRPMLHVGQCHLALGKLALARSCFDTVVSKSDDPGMVTRAQVYLQAMHDGAANPTEDRKDSASA